MVDNASKFGGLSMIYNRKKYVQILADKQWNGRIKVITGLRRCGKSTVLFDLFKSHLLEDGVRPDHILCGVRLFRKLNPLKSAN